MKVHKYPRKLKDQEFILAKIKIRKVRSVVEEFKGTVSYKDKLLCIEIDKGYSSRSTCFKHTKKGEKDLIKFIKEDLYLG